MAKKEKEAAVTEEIKAVAEEIEAVSEPDKTEEFIMRKLTVINKMSDSAKAKRLAERVLMNRKG